MVGQTVGEIVASRDSKFKPGDKVLTSLGWQRYGTAKAEDVTRDRRASRTGFVLPRHSRDAGHYRVVRPVGDRSARSRAKRSWCRRRRGRSAASSASSRRSSGCRVVGIAGGTAKCDYVANELGFDACVDYKSGDLHENLRRACPAGVDVYFENVGGEMLDTLLRQMNRFSRIVVCGLIAQYNATEPYGYKQLRSVLVNRIRMQGMIVFDWKDRYGEAIEGFDRSFRRRTAQISRIDRRRAGKCAAED